MLFSSKSGKAASQARLAAQTGTTEKRPVTNENWINGDRSGTEIALEKKGDINALQRYRYSNIALVVRDAALGLVAVVQIAVLTTPAALGTEKKRLKELYKVNIEKGSDFLSRFIVRLSMFGVMGDSWEDPFAMIVDAPPSYEDTENVKRVDQH
ncbi:uncharacterized protein N7506_009470 [Penicillium brevicompactum]|uniref:uncharacterized protein n=1 Tax=Penicillium brevicompactum TaxID=5074 RepID=UPI0025408350|nr:uncharacterized protein N7506_009470 [Penicillium brevicompactum]KAJ5326368.1 hypothetical protein N7506_009470 [Penicillium brevicompactum]